MHLEFGSNKHHKLWLVQLLANLSPESGNFQWG
jgi:hypothetical protein